MALETETESRTSAGVRELALSYLGQGKTDTAERLLRELLALRPEDVQGLRLLALILQSQGKSDEAIATLQKAVGLAPAAAHVHADLASLYRSLARPQEAAQCMRQALELEPTLSAGWWLLGDVLVDTGDVAGATRAYAQAARTDRFRDAIAAAGEHLARHEAQPAERIFRDILRQEGKHIAALCGLSAVALLAGQPAQAERMLKVAQRQSPHSPMVWRGMAQALMEAGRFEEAEAAIRRALRVDPDQPRNWVMLGSILARRF
ncbi:MAG: tetratricopeptide repeat protein, partial [Proteobacteria bacterium]|nr:tetratricopeptide repeat protein [Pseudomonadota bacterium]